MFLALGSLASGIARPWPGSHDRRPRCQNRPARRVYAKQGRCSNMDIAWTLWHEKEKEPFTVCVFKGFHVRRYLTSTSCQNVNLCKSPSGKESSDGFWQRELSWFLALGNLSSGIVTPRPGSHGRRLRGQNRPPRRVYAKQG